MVSSSTDTLYNSAPTTYEQHTHHQHSSPHQHHHNWKNISDEESNKNETHEDDDNDDTDDLVGITKNVDSLEDELLASSESTMTSYSSDETNEILQETEQVNRNITTFTFEFKGNINFVQEPTTKISYPEYINNMKFIGCGVRTKYFFIHAYAVGVYFKSSDLQRKSIIKTDQDMEQFLLNPQYSRLFRIVLNREVSSKLYIGATMDALQPLMRGKDLDK